MPITFKPYELDFLDSLMDDLYDPDKIRVILHEKDKPYFTSTLCRFGAEHLNDCLFDCLDKELLDVVDNGPWAYTSITSLQYPGDLIIVPIKAFYNTSNLKSAIIEEGIERIKFEAFKFSNIEHIKLPKSLKIIDDEAFMSCALKDVIIPDGVKRIDSYAFSKCKELTKLTLGSHVTDLMSNAFSYCGLTEVTVPGTCTTIGPKAFSNCYNLTNVTIEDGVQVIGDQAFFQTGVKVLELPQSVKVIGNHIIGIWKQGGVGGWYASSTRDHKFKIRGLSKDEAREYAKNKITFNTASAEAEFIRKLI